MINSDTNAIFKRLIIQQRSKNELMMGRHQIINQEICNSVLNFTLCEEYEIHAQFPMSVTEELLNFCVNMKAIVYSYLKKRNSIIHNLSTETFHVGFPVATFFYNCSITKPQVIDLVTDQYPLKCSDALHIFLHLYCIVYYSCQKYRCRV